MSPVIPAIAAVSPSIGADTAAAVMFAAMSSGADFGGGVWDLVAGGPRRGEAPRALIDEVVTPVWEANHVWLIFVLVVLWTAFSPAFAAIMITLFVPLSLSLLGIFFRGIGFSFRHTAETLRVRQATGAMFAASSLNAPFFMGTVVGAIATGAVHAPARGSDVAAWTSLTALLTGALFVAACAYIGAYLVGDAQRLHPELEGYFARRATAAGLVAGALAAGTLAELSVSGPYLFGNLTGRALPLVATSGAAGLAVLVMIRLGRLRGLRIVAALAVASVVWAWGWAQYPELLPGSLSLSAGSAPSGTIAALLVVTFAAAVVVAPGFVVLLALQQRNRLREIEEPSDLRRRLAASGEPAGGGPGRRVAPALRATHAPAAIDRSELAIGAAALMAALADSVRRFLRRRHRRQ